MRNCTALLALSLFGVPHATAGGEYLKGTVTAVKQDSFEVRLEDGKVRSLPVTENLLKGKIHPFELMYRNHLRELKVGYLIEFHIDEGADRPARCNEILILNPPQPKYRLPKSKSGPIPEGARPGAGGSPKDATKPAG
jgi:hypothetical protein